VIGENVPSPLTAVLLKDSVFPARTLIISTPPRSSLPGSLLHVTEDGQPVPNVALTPLASLSSTTLKGSSLGSRSSGAPASHYIVRYVSGVPSGEQEAELSITVDGVGAVDLDYNAPAAASAAKHKARTFWTSGTGLLSVSFGAAVLVAFAILMLLVPLRRRGALQRRVGEFTTQPIVETFELSSGEKADALAPLERLLERMSWWEAFRENVEIARFERSAVQLVAITAALTIAGAVVVGVLLHTPVFSFVVLPLGPFALHSLVRYRLRKQRALFHDQLATHLQELSSAMRAGHGLVSGLAAMVKGAIEPSRGEWNRVLADEQLGMPLEAAMRPLARRMDSDEIEQVALVAALHHRTGGNMAEVLDRVADGVRERAELRRELHTLTAQARLSRWIVTLLPPTVLGMVELINPSYLQPLFHTTSGAIVLCVGGAFLIAGSLVMRAITDIKV
jgi:tight adherence protein B